MPAVDVAPVYSDPFVQDHYDGMARLIEAVPDTADKTVNAITCRFYCIRFFYTSVDRRRWVEVSAITTWQDTEDRFCPIPAAWTQLEPTYSRTVLRLEAATPAGEIKVTYPDCPALTVDETILGVGCTYAIDLSCHWESYVHMILSVHDNTDPTVTRTILASTSNSALTPVFLLWYVALNTPHIVAQGESFSLRLGLFAKEVDENDGFVSLKAPFLRLERTI